MQDALGSVQSVLVLGGGSDIALATLRELVQRRARTIVLAARDPDALEDGRGRAARRRRDDGRDRRVRRRDHRDATTRSSTTCSTAFGDFDVALLAFGVLGDQEEAEHDAAAALDIAEVNYLGTVSVAVPVAQRITQQGHGTIVALSSVAGERARRSNFVYGSSKAGMDAFFQGLGDSLVGTGVKVMIVRPGFVHTKMTDGHGRRAALDDRRRRRRRDRHAASHAGSETVWVPSTAALRDVGPAPRPPPVFRKLPALTMSAPVRRRVRLRRHAVDARQLPAVPARVAGPARRCAALAAAAPALAAAAATGWTRDDAKAERGAPTSRRARRRRRSTRLGARFADDVVARPPRAPRPSRAPTGTGPQGHRLVIVSASLSVYLDPIAERLGLRRRARHRARGRRRRPTHRRARRRERARTREGPPPRRVARRDAAERGATAMLRATATAAATASSGARARRSCAVEVDRTRPRSGLPDHASGTLPNEPEVARRHGSLARCAFLVRCDGLVFGTRAPDLQLAGLTADDFGGPDARGLQRAPRAHAARPHRAACTTSSSTSACDAVETARSARSRPGARRVRHRRRDLRPSTSRRPRIAKEVADRLLDPRPARAS